MNEEMQLLASTDCFDCLEESGSPHVGFRWQARV